MRRKAAALLLCLLLCLSLGCEAFAEDSKNEYEPVKIYFDGLLSCRGYDTPDGIYMPLDALCTLAGIELKQEKDDENGVLHLYGRGLDISSAYGEDYISVNGRYLFSPGGLPLIDGRLCLYAESAAMMFSTRLEAGEDGKLNINTGRLQAIGGGMDYYYDAASVEDIFWMARIINSEAGKESLAGMLAVGQVVLNRVADERFPNSVFGVIFDRGGGVQFTPVEDATVYVQPEELSVIAACMCYEGYDIIGSSMYFVNPRTGDSSWFDANKEYFTSVGNHDFYVDR